jgi:secreted trypsin-like serine protease
LLRLKTPASLNFYVQPICLPRTEKLRTTNLDGLSLEVAGWGLTENRTKSAIKLKVSVAVVPKATCTTIFPTRNIWDKQLCAGGQKGKDSCNGDSGGPLMKEVVDGKQPFWYLAGVVSYGHRNCGTENFPGVYTKVSEYFEWILANIQE